MIFKKKINDIESEMESILSFKDNSELDEFKVKILQLKFMEIIDSLMNESNMSKSDLSLKINKSKSFVSQLFSTDKLLNIKTLTQLQDVFEVDFNLNYTRKSMNVEYTPCSNNIINFKKIILDKKFKIEAEANNPDFHPYVPQSQSNPNIGESA
jgi:hypothetical protein